MSVTKSTKTPVPATTAAVQPKAAREEAPVRWPSVASSGAGVYLSHPEPKDGTAA